MINELNLYTRIYGFLHNRKGLHRNVLTPFRRMVRWIAAKRLPKYLSQNCVNCKGNQQCDLIVSLTSFLARINNVWQVIECMKRQTIRPAKILLWLSKDQFSEESLIPASLRYREDDCFEIRMVDGDIRSHKKYYYVSQEYPESLIILVDDDLYYPTNLIKHMLQERNRRENVVVCNYGYCPPYAEDGRLVPYSSWNEVYQYIVSRSLFFGSGGGTMFKPSELYKDLINKELFLKLTPKADDVWLNAMVRLADLDIVMLKNGIPLPVPQESNVTLSSENVGRNENDIQINNVREHYNNKVYFRL